MRTFKLKVREIHEVEHVVTVPPGFKPYDAANLNDWAHELSAQDSEPTETFDIQFQCVLAAEEVEIN